MLCVLAIAEAAGITAAPQTPDITLSTVNLRCHPISGAAHVRVYLMADTRGAKMLLATLPDKTDSYRVVAGRIVEWLSGKSIF